MSDIKVVNLQEKKQMYIYLDKYTYWKQATTFNTSENDFQVIIFSKLITFQYF